MNNCEFILSLFVLSGLLLSINSLICQIKYNYYNLDNLNNLDNLENIDCLSCLSHCVVKSDEFIIKDKKQYEEEKNYDELIDINNKKIKYDQAKNIIITIIVTFVSTTIIIKFNVFKLLFGVSDDHLIFKTKKEKKQYLIDNIDKIKEESKTN